MNSSRPVEFFILDGLKDQSMLPFVFTVYISILSGNSMIIYLVRTDPKLNTPMYFFLHNLSFSDVIYTSVTMPKMLSVMLTGVKTISKTGCFLQMYFFLSMAVTGRAMLTAMAFDRYVAICNPLRYTTIMTKRVCILLVFVAWGFGVVIVLPPAVWATQVPYCGPNVVKHMFCDHSSVVVLACTDTTRNSILALTNALLGIISSFLLILTSYICIGRALRKMNTADQLKALATCVSHLIVVCIAYLSATFVYISYRVAKFDPELQDAIKRVFSKCTTASHKPIVRKTVPSITCEINTSVVLYLKNVVNSPPLTFISYNRSEWGDLLLCYRRLRKQPSTSYIAGPQLVLFVGSM
ncbi:putative olfactory receptor 6C75 [Triplophysa rosa]|uniref:Olfactory receptor 6C75 n=1 Tax=Triplophysa rosa TaxID=992332 RepID=A0A9W7WDY5_TRIRA|nr:putative olfactory receptor 6C75 [Triplophysa rosa]